MMKKQRDDEDKAFVPIQCQWKVKDLIYWFKSCYYFTFKMKNCHMYHQKYYFL